MQRPGDVMQMSAITSRPGVMSGDEEKAMRFGPDVTIKKEDARINAVPSTFLQLQQHLKNDAAVPLTALTRDVRSANFLLRFKMSTDLWLPLENI